MKVVIVTLILLTLLADVPMATASPVTVFGAKLSCEDWVQGDMGDSAAESTFVAGFLSGMAVATNKNVLESTDLDSATAWMTSYCSENPSSTVTGAAEKLFFELERRMKGGRSRSPR